MAEKNFQAELDKKIEEMFKKYDSNENNAIDEEELAEALKSSAPGITKEIIHQTFLSLDLDKNTKLTFEEFKNFVYKTVLSANN